MPKKKKMPSTSADGISSQIRLLVKHLSEQRRSYHQGDDRHQLNQDIHGRSRGVLEGITHGVTDDGRFVHVRTAEGGLDRRGAYRQL